MIINVVTTFCTLNINTAIFISVKLRDCLYFYIKTRKHLNFSQNTYLYFTSKINIQEM